MKLIVPRDPDKQLLYKIKAAGKKEKQILRTAAAPYSTKSVSPDAAPGLPAENPYTSPLTTKGDLFTYDTADARLGVGTDGYLLSANSSEGTGLEWIDPLSVGSKVIGFPCPMLVDALSGTHTSASTVGFPGIASTVPSNSNGQSLAYDTSPTVNFSTGAVTQYLRISTRYSRFSNTLLLSSDYLLYCNFAKLTSTATGYIIMREPAAVSGAYTNISFHLTDGTTVSSAPGTQFSSLGTGWGVFNTGSVDLSSYGNNLRLVFKFNGNNTDAGSNVDAVYRLDFHSMYVVFS